MYSQPVLKPFGVLHATFVLLPSLLYSCVPLTFAGGGVDDDTNGCSAGHRVLVFAQLKSMLDLVERDVLGPAGVRWVAWGWWQGL